MKNLLTMLLMSICFIGWSQNYSHDPKTISPIPTESKSLMIEVKNLSEFPEVFIIYRHDNSDKFWQRIGSISVFGNTVGKFYVEKGFIYGKAVEGKRPHKLGSDLPKWEVRNQD